MIYCFLKKSLSLKWFIIILLVLTPEAVLQAQPRGNVTNPGLKMLPDDPRLKIGSELAALKAELAAGKANSRRPTATSVDRNLLQIQGNYVVIEAVAEGNQTARLLTDLTALGMIEAASYGRMVSGLIPIQALDKAASLKTLRFARPGYKPMHQAGEVTSQGDVALYADSTRKEQFVNGKGSKIGVLSDSYNSRNGADKGIKSGDLPGKDNPNGFTTPVQVLKDLGVKDFDRFYSDEGRAMMEIIHDVAPGAELAFHTAFLGQAGFAKGILDLQKAGCNIITDDIGYLNEPMFQDGIIAQAVDKVKHKGVSYFSAAGNESRSSYEASYKAGGPTMFGSKYVFGKGRAINAHNFAPAGQKPDLIQRIKVPVGYGLTISFQYSQPFYSVGDGSSPGAASDLDIFLLTDDTTNIVARSTQYNIGADPVEVFGFYNAGGYPNEYFNLLIDKREGPAPDLIKYVLYTSNNVKIEEYNTASGTVLGHSNAAGAIATGAVYYQNTPAFNDSIFIPESFSSAGGTPILLDPNGNRQAAEIRQKPEVMAPDGVNTTFFGGSSGGKFYFFGTSAAAPHAAAVAALMQEASGNTLSPDKIKESLQETAINMKEPGFDFDTGYGFINAVKAVQKVAKPAVRSFALVNANTGKVIQTIKEGEEINLTRLSSRNVHIRATTAPVQVGSVVFTYEGAKTVENEAPYDFPGSSTLYLILQEGNYTITATPYDQPGGKGESGIPLTIHFKVVEEKITRFELINVKDGTVLGVIDNNDVLNLADLPARLNIRAISTPEVVGSIRFNLNGILTTENTSFYEVAGSSGGYINFAPGNFTLTATIYPRPLAQGVAGGSRTIEFKVINSSTAQSILPKIPDLERTNWLTASPNPFRQQAKLRFSLPETDLATLTVYDLNGAPVAFLHNGEAKAHKQYEYILDGTSLPSGLYISRLVTKNRVFHQKLKLDK